MLAAPHGKRDRGARQRARPDLDRHAADRRRAAATCSSSPAAACAARSISRTTCGTASATSSRAAQPDHVVLETTGIAEPAAILDGLVQACRERRSRERDRCRRAWCASSTPRPARARSTSARRRASRRRPRIACCSRSSTSRRADAVRATHARLDELAPARRARELPARRRRRARDDRVGARAAPAARVDEQRRTTHDATRTAITTAGQLVAVSFADDAPLVGERVLAVIEALGERLVRAKGFVHLAGEIAARLRRARRRAHRRSSAASRGAPRRGAPSSC